MPKTKEVKRIEAEARKVEHDKRTPLQQLKLIEQRPGASQREADKLRAGKSDEAA